MRSWLARQRGLVDFAVAAMARRRGRHLGLLAVYTVLVFALASVMLLAGALRHEAARLLDAAPDVVAQGLQGGRHAPSRAADLEALRTLRGVQRVEGRLWGYLYDTATGANFTLQVPSADWTAPPLQRGQAVVGEGVARVRRVGAGQRLFLVSPAGPVLNLQLQSVLPVASAAVTSDLVLLCEADFRAFFQLPADEFTDIALRVRNPQEVDKVAEKTGLALRRHRIVTRADMQRTYESLFRWREGILLAMLSAAVLAFAILAFDKASGLSAEERREIGILKAIGWDTRDVLRMKLWEATLIAGTAFVLGFVGAYVHVFAFSAPLLEAVLRGWSVLYPRQELAPVLDGLDIGTLAALTVLPYLAAVTVPVWRAAAADPDEVMR